jgi:hypothetical protein
MRRFRQWLMRMLCPANYELGKEWAQGNGD